ncbi:MAG: YtxH domain-containing protein [Acidobacteria bacterium]|nr:YtxH domain-containing protein [Acidobacteriota bacterium]
MADNEDSRLIWFVAGAALGATIALLFAPQSGEETRGMIQRKAREGRDILEERGHELAERGRELFDRGRKIADEAADIFEQGKKLADG